MTLREQLISAHRSQDWELATLLSQAQEQVKQASRHVCRCGVPLSTKSREHVSGLCRDCLNFEKYHKRKLT